MFDETSGADNPSVAPSTRPVDTPRFVEEVVLPEHLVRQFEHIIARNEAYNQGLPDAIRRPEKEYNFLNNFFHSFFLDRISRAKEIILDRYQAVVERMRNRILDREPFVQVRCMDGRDIPIHGGFFAGTTVTYRIAGGEPAGFSRDENRILQVSLDSDFIRMLVHTAENSDSKVIAVVWGAHLGCAAAQMDARSSSGPAVQDGGILQLIDSRNEKIEAVQRALKELAKRNSKLKGKKFVFMLDVFNVHNGHRYWGVEAKAAIKFGKEGIVAQRPDGSSYREKGYTERVLDQAADNVHVISTKELVQSTIYDSKILRTFRRHTIADGTVFRLDWKNDYTGSAEGLEERLFAMIEEAREEKDGILKIIQNRVEAVYQDLNKPTAERTDEIKKEIFDRSVSILMSAYVAFLDCLPTQEDIDRAKEQGREINLNDLETLRGLQNGEFYRDKEHVEQGIKASTGTHPPYKHTMLALYIDDPNLINNIQIGQAIIREHRYDGLVRDESETITDNEEFARAPIPLVLKHVAEGVSEADWNIYQQIDFSELHNLEWEDWTYQEHIRWLNKIGIVVPGEIIGLTGFGNSDFIKGLAGLEHDRGIVMPSIVRALERMRQTMILLYGNPTVSTHLKENQLLAMCIIADDDKRPRIGVPYIKFRV